MFLQSFEGLMRVSSEILRKGESKTSGELESRISGEP